MSRGTVVLLGTLSGGHAPLADTVAEFGWSLETVADGDGLQDLADRRQVVAILFDPRAFEGSSVEEDAAPEDAWSNAMNAVRGAAPGACIIACQKFSDPIPWPELANQGAFHSLSLPLDASELRRSLGFVWAAKRRHSVIQLDQALREGERDGAQSSLEGAVQDDAASSPPDGKRESAPQAGRAAKSVA